MEQARCRSRETGIHSHCRLSQKASRPSVCAVEAWLWTVLSGSLGARKVGSCGQAQPEEGREDTSAHSYSERTATKDWLRSLGRERAVDMGGIQTESHVLKFQILPECPISCEPTLLNIGRFLKDISFPNHKYNLFTVLKKKKRKYWEKVLLIHWSL